MLKEINLDAPAFGANAQKIEADNTSEPTTETSQVKELGQDDAELVTRKLAGEQPVNEEETEEEQKVPYSRFKTIADQKREAEERAALLEQQLLERDSYKEQEVDRPEDEKLLDYMIKVYGDNENTRKAYEIELQRIAYIEQRAEERALRSLEEARKNEVESLTRNEKIIDNNLEDLSNYLGRKLSAAEESGILEIVDEYTPKDEDGNYSGDLLPFDKAYEIYQLKNQTSAQTKKKARAVVTSLTSRDSEGEPSSSEKRNEDFNPLDWNSYRRRI